MSTFGDHPWPKPPHRRREYTKADVDAAWQQGYEAGKDWWAGRRAGERYLGDRMPYLPEAERKVEETKTDLRKAAAALEARRK